VDETTWPASSHDLSEVLLLSRSGRQAIEDARGGALWLERDAPPEPLEHTFQAAISDADSLLLVGAIDSVPVGLLLVAIEVMDGRPLAVCRELYVAPDARGVGIGELMMNAAIEWATEHGAVGIEGYALPGDRATKNFFETFKMVARGIVVHRPLPSA